MSETVKGNARKFVVNTVFSILSWLSPLLLALITTPILVRGLGTETYGIYVLILGFITYFFTYGVGKSAAKFAAEYRARNDNEMVNKIVSASLIINVVISTIAAAIIAILSKIIVGPVLDISSPLDSVAETALLLACITVIIAVPGQVFQFVLQGIHRFDRFLLIVNTNAVLLAAGNIALAYFAPDVIFLFLWNLFITSGTSIASFILAKKAMPTLIFDPKIKGEPLRLVWRYTLGIIGYQIFGNGLLLFERSWLIRNFGPETVAHYVIPMNLALYIHIFCSSLVLALFPMLNEMLDDRAKMRRVYEVITKVVLSVAVFSALTGVAVGRTFLSNWLGEDFADASYTLLVIHIGTFSFLAMGTIVWQIAESFRSASMNSIVTLAWALLSIPAMILLSRPYGPVGVAYGRAIGVSAFIILIILVEKRFLEKGTSGFWTGSIIRVVIAAGVSFIAESFIVSFFGNGWGQIILAVSFGGLIFASVALILRLFDHDERQMFFRAAGL